MSEKLLTFGQSKDGTVSRCRAKDPNNCRYHVKHSRMTERTAATYNEAIYKANATNYSYDDTHNHLSKQSLLDTYDKTVTNVGDKEFATFNDGMLRYEALSYLSAERTANPSDIVDNLPETPATADDEIRIAQTLDHKNIGVNYSRSEQCKIFNKLVDYSEKYKTEDDGLEDEGLNTPKATPLQDYGFKMLANNPQLDNGQVQHELVYDCRNYRMAAAAAPYFISSPYADEETKKVLFNMYPATSVESCQVPKEYIRREVDKELGGTAVRAVDDRFLVNVTKNPNIPPKSAAKIYDFYRLNYGKNPEEVDFTNSSERDKGVYEMRHKALQQVEQNIRLNPNKTFRTKFAEINNNIKFYTE